MNKNDRVVEVTLTQSYLIPNYISMSDQDLIEEWFYRFPLHFLSFYSASLVSAHNLNLPWYYFLCALN